MSSVRKTDGIADRATRSKDRVSVLGLLFVSRVPRHASRLARLDLAKWRDEAAVQLRASDRLKHLSGQCNSGRLYAVPPYARRRVSS